MLSDFRIPTQYFAKSLILIVGLLLWLYRLSAQTNMGIGTHQPDSSAVLDLSSDRSGLLPPRMNTIQRDLIDLPTEGLLIFNTDSECLEVFNGFHWNKLCEKLTTEDVACPFGLVSFNESTCIEWQQRSAQNWFGAVESCLEDGFRLCTWQEWYLACDKSESGQILPLENLVSTAEWTSTGGHGSTMKRAGNGNCMDRVTSNASALSTYRCCSDKFSANSKILSNPIVNPMCEMVQMQEVSAISDTGLLTDGNLNASIQSSGLNFNTVLFLNAGTVDMVRWFSTQPHSDSVQVSVTGLIGLFNTTTVFSTVQKTYRHQNSWNEIYINPQSRYVEFLSVTLEGTDHNISISEIEAYRCQ